MHPRVLSRCIHLAKSHGSCIVEFEEQGEELRVFLHTWDKDVFWRVCVATLDRNSSDPHQEVSRFARVIDALGPYVPVVSISGGSTIPVEAFWEYLGSGYCQNLIDYPCFDLRLFEHCLQWTTFSVFGSSDGFAFTEYIVNQLTVAETGDWMSSCTTLKNAMLTNDLGMLHLVDIVANIIGVWLLIVSYLEETGRKDDGDSVLVSSSSFD